VGGSLVSVRPDPDDFRFKQPDPFIQLGLRVRGKVFAC
jgi:hypothetical protein